jgi:hypothetical protein
MKIKATLVALGFFCLLCAGSALAQNAPVLSNTPQPLQMSDHAQHADEHSMRLETSLLGSGSHYTYAQGEVPLAELGSPIYHTPLGDIARDLRKEHSTAPKAVKVLEQ